MATRRQGRFRQGFDPGELEDAWAQRLKLEALREYMYELQERTAVQQTIDRLMGRFSQRGEDIPYEDVRRANRDARLFRPDAPTLEVEEGAGDEEEEEVEGLEPIG